VTDAEKLKWLNDNWEVRLENLRWFMINSNEKEPNVSDSIEQLAKMQKLRDLST